MTKEEIRKHFTDFRYLNSTDEPHILKEFVRYDEVLELIKSMSYINEKELDELANKCADSIIATTKDEPFPKDVEDSVWFGIIDGYKEGYYKAKEL